MLDIYRLADRNRPVSSCLLSTSLFSAVLLVTTVLFGHLWLVLELSTVFLSVRDNIGLFSVNQYSLFGGGGTREKATFVSLSLAEWERQICQSAKDFGNVPSFTLDGTNPLSKACTYVWVLRVAGLLTAAILLPAAWLFVQVLLDLRKTLQISDALAPHTDPFRRTDTREIVAGLGQHLGFGTRDLAANVPYTSLEDNSPSLMELQSLGSVDLAVAHDMALEGKQLLERCKRRLNVNLSLLGAAGTIWLVLYLKAHMARDDLGRMVQVFGPIPPMPTTVRLSFSFFAIVIIMAIVFLLQLFHDRLLAAECSGLHVHDDHQVACVPP